MNKKNENKFRCFLKNWLFIVPYDTPHDSGVDLISQKELNQQILLLVDKQHFNEALKYSEFAALKFGTPGLALYCLVLLKRAIKDKENGEIIDQDLARIMCLSLLILEQEPEFSQASSINHQALVLCEDNIHQNAIVQLANAQLSFLKDKFAQMPDLNTY